MVERVAETRFTSALAARHGRRRCSATRRAATSSSPWSTARSIRTQPTLVRMHCLDLFADVLGEASERAGLLEGAMAMIEAEGSGVVVALHAAAPGSLSRAADLRSGKPPKAARRCAAMASARRSSPRSASTT